MTTTPHPTSTPAAPVLELVDPATLLVDRNIRTHLHIDKALIGSIKENGILVPITVVRDDTGGLRVRAGHRRTAAAIEAGLDLVPVVIVADEDTTDKGQAARVIGQVVENLHRRAVDDVDTVAAVEQLAAFGVSVAAITRRTKLPKATVTAAAAVAGSDAASKTLTSDEPLTLEHAAWVAEFDDDPDLQERLIRDLGQRWATEHTVQRLRDTRDERRAVATIQARFPDLSWIDRPDWNEPTTRLSGLTDVALADWPAKDLPKAITEDTHSQCPGAVAWLDDDHRYHELPDDDPAHHDDPLTVDRRRWQIVHGCSQPHHHTLRSQAQREQAGKARQAVANGQDPDEARKAERRRLIALNKAGDAAQVVRREWLTQFCHRKTTPKDASAWLLAGLAARHQPWDDLRTEGLLGLRNALGIDNQTDPEILTVQAATPARAAHLHLCAVLWAYEAHMKRDTWRAPHAHHIAYLAQMAACGYPLSEVERIIIGDLREQAAYDAITRDD